jgi:hypothetical protein
MYSDYPISDSLINPTITRYPFLCIYTAKILHTLPAMLVLLSTWPIIAVNVNLISPHPTCPSAEESTEIYPQMYYVFAEMYLRTWGSVYLG